MSSDLLSLWPKIVAVAGAMVAAACLQASESLETEQPSIRGAALEVPRYVIANGGGRSTGNIWVIRGTIGQADADPGQPATDGSGFYAITGGFWPGVPPTQPRADELFDDRFEDPSN